MTSLWEAARHYLGVPWQDGGRTRAGLDCLGLVLLASRDVGIEFDPEGQLDRRASPGLLMRAALTHTRRVPLRAAAAGDYVFADMGQAQQIGILAPSLGSGAESGLNCVFAAVRRAVVEQPFRAQLTRVKGVFRPCGVV